MAVAGLSQAVRIAKDASRHDEHAATAGKNEWDDL
jgi:hypothetical protein